MPAELSGRARELLEQKNFATVSTLRKDGTVQANVVWVDADNGSVLVNSAEGRAWPANLRRDPRITVTVPNWENPYEHVTISGKVVEMTHDGADEHIDKLAKKYLDADTYPFRKEGEQRIKIRIEPERVAHYGG